LLIDDTPKLDYFASFLIQNPPSSVGIDLEGNLKFEGDIELIQVSVLE
jgi:hypothetical protein